ncbi:MAG: hypothetical protein KGI90_10790 [Burkholderiales bacterium]|nr:hypothetical protein [Burkholderiales bacterium]MDE2276010.1 hypothetical protein [Burkholderiales bacterium]
MTVAVVVGVPAWAGEPLVVGPGGTPMALQDAVNQARDGDTIELLAGQYHGTVTIDHRRLTLRGLGGKPPLIQGDAKLGLGGALFTVIGGEVTLEHLEFRGARNLDGSGAGVRQVGGHLTVRRCSFFDNEHGLVAANDAQAELTVEDSVFGLAPHVVGGLYHLLNVGRIGKLSVTGSRFQQGFEGHLLRSRARESYIAYNFIHDGLRGGASYEIEIADGGLATVLGNVIAQGSQRQNPVLVAYGTEGRAWPLNRLYLVNNTMINYGWLPGWFLRVFEGRVGSDTKVYEINNLIVGPGIFWFGAPGHFAGNRHATLGMLRDPATYAFELPPDSIWRGSGVDPSHIDGRDLAPKAEFDWPIGIRPLKPGRTSWSPGAYQR